MGFRLVRKQTPKGFNFTRSLYFAPLWNNAVEILSCNADALGYCKSKCATICIRSCSFKFNIKNIIPHAVRTRSYTTEQKIRTFSKSIVLENIYSDFDGIVRQQHAFEFQVL